MDYIIPLSAGAVHKLYDDITDTGVPITDVQREFLKVLMVTLMTVFFMKSPTTSFLFVLAVAIYWVLGNIDNAFWKSCMVIPIVTTLSTMSEWKFLGIFDVVQRSIFLGIFAISFFLEEKFFPEETSESKTFFRSVVVVLLPVLIWLTQHLSSGHFVMSFGLFSVGYLISNLVFQFIHESPPPPEDV